MNILIQVPGRGKKKSGRKDRLFYIRGDIKHFVEMLTFYITFAKISIRYRPYFNRTLVLN